MPFIYAQKLELFCLLAILNPGIKYIFMLSPEFIEEMKAKLLEQKERLANDLAQTPAHTEVGEDYDENATEIQLDEANQDVRAVMEQDLAKIDKALAKIESGTYGTDDDGQDISEDRLRAIPWADKAI